MPDTTTQPSLKPQESDSVLIAREDLQAVYASARGHKVAGVAINAGEPVRNCGQIIGFASRDIAPGEHVHVHNLEYREFARGWRACGRSVLVRLYGSGCRAHRWDARRGATAAAGRH